VLEVSVDGHGRRPATSWANATYTVIPRKISKHGATICQI